VNQVRDALLAKAEHFAAIGDVAQALIAYEVALGKTVGAGTNNLDSHMFIVDYFKSVFVSLFSGPKIDVVFAVLRVLLFANDVKAYGKKLDELQKLIDEVCSVFFIICT
jgi:hypothetical protein